MSNRILNNGAMQSEFGDEICRMFKIGDYTYRIEKKVNSSIFTLMVKNGDLVKIFKGSRESFFNIERVVEYVGFIKLILDIGI